MVLFSFSSGARGGASISTHWATSKMICRPEKGGPSHQRTTSCVFACDFGCLSWSNPSRCEQWRLASVPPPAYTPEVRFPTLTLLPCPFGSSWPPAVTFALLSRLCCPILGERSGLSRRARGRLLPTLQCVEPQVQIMTGFILKVHDLANNCQTRKENY